MLCHHAENFRSNFFVASLQDSAIVMLTPSPVDQAGHNRYRQQFFKTSMCLYHLENSCRKGDSCSHAHTPDELQSKPVLSKTRMCKQALRNGICADAQCCFAHDISELIQANTFFRTKMCEFHTSGAGCKLGDKCRYAHSPDELNTTLPEESSVAGSPNVASDVLLPPVDFNDSPDTGYPLKKRGSMGSRSTIASSSYASLRGSYASFQPAAVQSVVPMVFVYPSGFVPYYMSGGPVQPYED
jgi:hypothetical protein